MYDVYIIILCIYRNIPQVAIQAIYIIEAKSFDIIVCNAMIFSIFSIVYRLFQAILRQNKQNSVITNTEYHYRAHGLYAMKIVCDQFQSYHRFSHNTITTILCSIFRIDNSGNNIDIFYIYGVRQGLIIYIEISNYGIYESKLDLFSSILKIGDGQEGAWNEMFELELDQCFQLGIKKTNDHDVMDQEVIGDRIKVFVKPEKNKLSVDRDAVIVDNELEPGSPSGLQLLKQVSLNVLTHIKSSDDTS